MASQVSLGAVGFFCLFTGSWELEGALLGLRKGFVGALGFGCWLKRFEVRSFSRACIMCILVRR